MRVLCPLRMQSFLMKGLCQQQLQMPPKSIQAMRPKKQLGLPLKQVLMLQIAKCSSSKVVVCAVLISISKMVSYSMQLGIIRRALIGGIRLFLLGRLKLIQPIQHFSHLRRCPMRKAQLRAIWMVCLAVPWQVQALYSPMRGMWVLVKWLTSHVLPMAMYAGTAMPFQALLKISSITTLISQTALTHALMIIWLMTGWVQTVIRMRWMTVL